MFTSIGWGEILVILLLGLLIIGPERLPAVVQDVRAAIIAARRAINNVKQELAEDMGDDFSDISRPLGDIARLGAMGPRAALTKTLLDNDEKFLESFDPKKIMDSTMTVGQAYRRSAAKRGATGDAATARQNQPTDTPRAPQPQNQAPQARSPQPPNSSHQSSAGDQAAESPTGGTGMAWDDVT